MTDLVALTVPAEHRFDGVVGLVLGGLGSRLDLPVDRIDDLGLAVTSMRDAVTGTEMTLEVSVFDDRVRLAIGPLEPGATSDRARRRLVDALLDSVDAVIRDGDEWLELELRREGPG